MMGRQDTQGELFRPDSLHLDFVGPNTFYGWLAQNAPRLFPDEMFARLYAEANGRPSKPPSQMMVLALLQFYDNVSDAEAINRMTYDLRWKVALRLHMEEVLCSESCLREFRTMLVLNEFGRELKVRSIQSCIEAGVLKKRKIKVATDTTPIIGRGAVKDTYNLLADAIVKLLRVGASLNQMALLPFSQTLDLARYVECDSIKATADIDWDDKKQREAFLNELVVDAQRALRWARGFSAEARSSNAVAPGMLEKFEEALALLNRIILQDVEFKGADGQEEKKGSSGSVEEAKQSASPSGRTADAPVDKRDGGEARPTGDRPAKQKADKEGEKKAGREARPESDRPTAKEAEAEKEARPEKQAAARRDDESAQEKRAEDQQGPATMKNGVEKDRVPSVHDPEQRHGRKSSSKRFDGHKGSATAETQSGVLLDTRVLPGNAEDSREHLESVEEAEQNLRDAWERAERNGAVPADGDGAKASSGPEASAADEAGSPSMEGDADATDCGVEASLGDCAYGTAKNRRAFADAERDLIAKQGAQSNGGRFTKEQFPKDPETDERVCPAGHRAQPRKRKEKWNGKEVVVNHYQWDTEVCASCPLRESCVKLSESESGEPEVRHGRTVRDHAEEELLAAARARQKSPSFRATYKEREVIEHRLARMIQLGGRQARYFGRKKTAFQWMMIAVVANLTKAAGAVGSSLCVVFGVIWALVRLRREIGRLLRQPASSARCELWPPCTSCA